MEKLLKVVYKTFKYAALRIGVFLLVLATPVGILMSFNSNAEDRQEQETNYYEQFIGEKGLKLDEQRRNAVIQVEKVSAETENVANCEDESDTSCE